MLKKLFYVFFLVLIFSSASFAKTNENNSTSNQVASEEGTYYLMAATLSTQNDAPSGEGGILSKNIRIINLGPIVNWKGVDYAPTVSADGKTLFYVSDRPGSIETKDGAFSHDFWAAKKANHLDTIFNTPYNIDTTFQFENFGVNTMFHEGAASIAADKQSLYFTGCNREDGFGSCDIYQTLIDGDKWGRPVNLGPKVNSEKFDSQPSIAADKSRIYFVSTRKGPNSNGDNYPKNFDIWYSDWDPDMEEWKQAQNLEAINTPGREESPFIGADGVTLFFSSDGWKPNYGEKDFYVTSLNEESKTWSTPSNLGEPINTSADEQFITLPASGDIIYFSSKRKDLANFQGNLDIFMAFVPTFFRTKMVVIRVKDECTGEFLPASIDVFNPVTNKKISEKVTPTSTEMTMIVANSDYGNPKDSIKQIDFEITANNPNYVPKKVVQRVIKPEITEDKDEAAKAAETIEITITLGERPVLTSIVEEGDYIRRTKKYEPKLEGYPGLVMEQIQTWDLYPLLNYVFFDLGSSKLPDRYILFKNNAQTKFFADTSIAGGTLNKYYHIMNIFGFRMNRYPDTKIEIVGTADGTSPEEKSKELTEARAKAVYDYFKDVWQISPDRMKLTYLPKPKVVSNLKDSFGIVENRRTEILCDDWRIMQPVFDKDPKTFPQPDTMYWVLKNGIEDKIIAKRRIEIERDGKHWKTLDNIPLGNDTLLWDWQDDDGKYPKDDPPYVAKLIITTNSGNECVSDPHVIPVMQVTSEKKKVQIGGDSTWERYNLILFPFDKFDAGPINERIMRDYVYERVKPTSYCEVVGHTDVVGMYEHNQRLSDKRATTVRNGINTATRSQYGVLFVRGVGEDEPLYTNDLPEGRFYNRTVQVIIKTPVSEYEK
ncbi:MAG: hypothetical protein A2X64_03330 [Ignavibacteria bacterium GWF2_33_9]|nr:MAG: hypothetical protein A2X64_03330 [Ignavibacteria bacterium GWF2_33_9]